MTVKTISRDELFTRAWEARANVEPGGDDGKVHALINGVLYVADRTDSDSAPRLIVDGVAQ